MKHNQTFVFFDTENDDAGNVTLVAAVVVRYRIRRGAIVGKDRTEHVFENRKSFIHFLEKCPSGTVAMSHNLEYDLVNIFGDWYRHLNSVFLKSQLISSGHGGVRFLDTVKHFPMSVAQLGQSVGIAKGKLDIHSKDYVLTDCRIIEKAMTSLMEILFTRYGIATGATAGGTAVRVWNEITQGNFLSGNYEPELSRKAYYGGRAEIFRPKFSGEVYCYDINSMYPYVMTFRYPRPELAPDPAMRCEYGLVRAVFQIERDSFMGVLPFRWKEKKLIFPVGTFETCVTYQEARQPGVKILRVLESYGTDAFCQPFLNYVEELYALRMESKSPAEKLCWKILLNSLYGKMGQRGNSSRLVSEHTLNAMIKYGKTGGQTVFPNMGDGRYIVDLKRPAGDFVNVVWAAYITSYSRIELNRVIAANTDKIMYCDTDSAWVFKKDLQGVAVGSALGQMKLDKTAVGANFVLPKLYQVGDEIAAKGVPAPINPETMKRDYSARKDFIAGKTARYKKPYRWREATLRQNSKKNETLQLEFRPNDWVVREKTLGTVYYKHLTGNLYRPVALPDDANHLVEVGKREPQTFT